MRKLRLSVAIGCIISLISIGTAYAYNSSNATYTGTVVVTNNGTAAAYNQTANFTLNTTAMINAGFLNASVNNSALTYNGQDVPYMPGASGNQSWFAFIGNISALSNPRYTLYVGGNQTMNSTQVYFPGAAGMAVTDNASLELGSNFTITQTGFIDTTAGANKWLVNKTGAFTTNISGEGNITSTLTTNQTLSPLVATANGSVMDALLVFGAANAWQAVATNDGNTTYIYQDVATAVRRNVFTTTDFTGPTSAAIVYVRVFIVAGSTGAGDHLAQTVVRVNGVNYDGTSVSPPPGSWTTYNTTYYTNPNSGTAWNISAINSMEIGVQLNVAGGNVAMATYVYAEVGYTAGESVTASGIASGNHTVTTNASNVFVSIVVDGIVKNTVSLNGTGVVNNSNNWTFATSNATPYLSSLNISINGTQQAAWTWQYKTTWPVLFTDLTGNGNTATPTFPAGGSSANVTANMTSLAPITQTTADPTNPAVTASNITANFTAPPGLYTELNISAPGANLTNTLLDGFGIPRAIFWFPWLFGLIGIAGFVTYWLTRSLLIQGVVMAFIIILFSLMGGFGYWVCIEFIIMALAIIVGSKQYGF